MADQGGGPAGSVPIGRLRATLLNAPLRWLGGGVAAVVVLVSGAFGGFDKVEVKDDLPAFTVDQAFDASGWKITVHSVRALDELKPLSHQEEKGWRWIIVVATVEVTGVAESTSLYEKSLQIRGIEGVPARHADHVALASDASEHTRLNPGVPTRVGFFWDQRASAPIPAELQVGVYGAAYELDKGSSLYGWVSDDAEGPPRAMRALPVNTQPVPS